MTRLVVVAVVLGLASTSAEAEDSDDPPVAVPTVDRERIDRGFMAAGVAIGGDKFFHGALTLEGGIKVPELPLWVHVIGSMGDAFDFEGGGTYRRVIGGMETRGCTTPYLCLLVDLDVGYQTSTWSGQDFMDPVEHHEGAVIAGRVGIDSGGARVRVRAAIEAVREHDHSNATTTAWETGLGLAFSVAYRL